MTLLEQGPVEPALTSPEGVLVALLVDRVADRYDMDPLEIRDHAVEILEEFGHCRVQAYLPILAEKRLRERLGGVAGARQKSTAEPDAGDRCLRTEHGNRSAPVSSRLLHWTRRPIHGE